MVRYLQQSDTDIGQDANAQMDTHYIAESIFIVGTQSCTHSEITPCTD